MGRHRQFIEDGETVDYKNLSDIKRFTTETGKIRPRRMTGLAAPQQRSLRQAIMRARYLALIPYCDHHRK